MKKLLCLILTLLIPFSVCACKQEEEPPVTETTYGYEIEPWMYTCVVVDNFGNIFRLGYWPDKYYSSFLEINYYGYQEDVIEMTFHVYNTATGEEIGVKKSPTKASKDATNVSATVYFDITYVVGGVEYNYNTIVLRADIQIVHNVNEKYIKATY